MFKMCLWFAVLSNWATPAWAYFLATSPIPTALSGPKYSHWSFIWWYLENKSFKLEQNLKMILQTRLRRVYFRKSKPTENHRVFLETSWKEMVRKTLDRVFDGHQIRYFGVSSRFLVGVARRLPDKSTGMCFGKLTHRTLSGQTNNFLRNISCQHTGFVYWQMGNNWLRWCSRICNRRPPGSISSPELRKCG